MSRINYNLRLIKAIAFDVDGVLSPSTIPLHPNGVPMRMVNIKDGYAIQLAVKHGYKIAVITGADTEAIRVRFAGLGVEDIYLKAGQKVPCLKEWMAKYGLEPEEVAYVGDDIPDFEVMQMVGLPVAPADAADDIKEIATYITDTTENDGVAKILEKLCFDQE